MLYNELPHSDSGLQQGYKTRNEINGTQYFANGKWVICKTHWATNDERNGQSRSQHGQEMLKQQENKWKNEVWTNKTMVIVG